MLILQIIKNIALACSEFFFLAGGGKKSKMHFFCSVEVSDMDMETVQGSITQ